MKFECIHSVSKLISYKENINCTCALVHETYSINAVLSIRGLGRAERCKFHQFYGGGFLGPGKGVFEGNNLLLDPVKIINISKVSHRIKED